MLQCRCREGGGGGGLSLCLHHVSTPRCGSARVDHAAQALMGELLSGRVRAFLIGIDELPGERCLRSHGIVPTNPRVVMAHGPMESIFKPVFVLMSGRALGFVAAFAIPVVLARVFDQSEFGTYKQLFLVYSTLYCIAQVGMAESLFYFLPAATWFGGRYALNAMLVLSIAGAACLALLWSVQSTIAYWLNNGALIGYIPLIGLYLLLMLASTVL